MKGIKRIAVLLACVLCIGFTACAKKSDTPSGPNDPDDPNGLPIVTPINPIEVKLQHYVTRNLHKLNADCERLCYKRRKRVQNRSGHRECHSHGSGAVFAKTSAQGYGCNVAYRYVFFRVGV